MKINRLLAGTLAFVLVAGMSMYAEAITMGFQNEYDPSNWTLIQNGGDGSVDSSGAPDHIMMTGSDSGSSSSIDTDFTITIPCDGNVMFDWIWTNADFLPSFDDGGYLVNGVFTQITDNTASDSGSENVAVLAGDVFGFRVASQDDLSAPGIFMEINEFKGPSLLDCAVGGEFLPIDSTALVLAGLQTSAIWMLPVLAGVAGAGFYLIKFRTNKE